MTNPMVNYAEIIKQTNSEMFNVLDEYKDYTVEQNQVICEQDRLPFSVGVINVTGDLNVGMMIRSACLMGAQNFYIFGRKKFDKRSTVGAENYINIKQFVYDGPIHADKDILNELYSIHQSMHDIVLCEQGGAELGKFSWHDVGIYAYKGTKLRTPLFLFGSESHGIPTEIAKNNLFNKVSIPQRGVLRSFNVSAAMNIICWDYIQEIHIL